MVVSLKMFPILEEALDLSGIFYVYTGGVIIGLPIVMKILPETKDLSINQINEVFVKKPHEKQNTQRNIVSKIVKAVGKVFVKNKISN